MIQRHLEAAFLPSGNYQCDINTVESLARTSSLTFEGGQPVHHYSTMCSRTHIMKSKMLNEGADVCGTRDNVTSLVSESVK